MASNEEWVVIGKTVILTISGSPVQGTVQDWTPAGVTISSILYTWLQIQNWSLQ